MDRSDEYPRDDRTAPPETERTGDILGLGGGPVPQSPADPKAEDDPESVAQRRNRMHSTEDEGVSNPMPERGKGATGIDMGAGGSGTGVSGE